jgi:hypothetical protein
VTHRRLFRTLTAVIAAGALCVTPLPATAATGPARGPVPVPVAAVLPVGRPTVVDLGFDEVVDDVLHVGSQVWVSHGDVVDVFGADGAPLHTIALVGAGDLARSPSGDPSGDRVFVTTATAIAVYDASTWTPGATWSTEPCPRHPVPLGPDRLYYAYGCPDSGAFGLAVLNLADGTATGTGIADAFSAAPTLLAGGAVLVAIEDAGTVTARSYLREGDGTITPLATRTISGHTDAVVSPDGSEVAIAVGTGAHRLDTAELQSITASVPGGSPTALAYAPAGDTFAIGLSGSSADQLLVRSTAGATPVSRSALRSAATGTANPAILPGSLAYSADGTLLRALVHPAGQHVSLLTATARPVTATVVTVRLTSPRRYADPVGVRITVPGRPHTAVHLVLADRSGKYPFDDTTDGAGRLLAPLDTDMNGTLTAWVAADLTHGAGVGAAAFRVPADFEVVLAGNSGARGGVLRFRSFAKIRGLASGLPARRFTVLLSIQALTRRGWRPAAPPHPAATDPNGLLGITVGEFDQGVRYRLMLRFAGDRTNAGTIAYSAPFQVG